MRILAGVEGKVMKERERRRKVREVVEEEISIEEM